MIRMHSHGDTPRPDRAALRRDAILLQYGVVFYNVFECVIALLVGHHVNSIALFGFGIDGTVEIAASISVLVYLKRDGRSGGSEWEGRVARFIGLTLIGLALFIANDAMFRLIYVVKPQESLVAIALASLSLLVMFRVARTERKLADGLNSPALHAESRETVVCAWLSAALLVGLGANFLFGLWWVDPAIAIAMAVYIAREGLDAFKTHELVHDHG
jgi:divalent metal cation (Fe/Co/Zn/Cd) transporter